PYEPQILDALDRAADEDVARGSLVHGRFGDVLPLEKPMLRPLARWAPSALRIEPHAGELPLRQLLHGIAHALAPETGRADPAERIGVEPKAACVIDPERADAQFARDLEGGLETRRE